MWQQPVIFTFLHVREYNVVSFALFTITGNMSKLATTHLVKEYLPYVHRDETALTIISSFEKRQVKRNESEGAGDKTNNPVIAVPSIPGCGKSTFLAHFFFCRCLRGYVEKWSKGLKPVVSLFTFNSEMSSARAGVALGLRILFGALRASCGWTESWPSFCERYFYHRGMTAEDAVGLLREIFGSERRIFIGVDEISKVDGIMDPKQNAETVMHNLCRILDNDGNTDIVMSSLTPAYIKDLLTGSQRPIQYVPIVPLQAEDLDETFRASGDELVRQLQDELSPEEYEDFHCNPLNERVVRNLHRQAGGHPRTVQMLKEAILDGRVLRWLIEFLQDKPEANPYDVMTDLAKMSVFGLYSAEPTNEQERDYILSVSARNVQDDPTFRVMMENGRCTIYESVASDGILFRISTTPASFFRMINTIRRTNTEELGTLSRAAKALFWTVAHVSEMWERAHCFSILSTIHCKRKEYEDGRKQMHVPMRRIVGVGHKMFGCRLEVDADLDVRIVEGRSAIIPPWRRNVLFVAPPRHAGFDLAVCMRGTKGQKIWIYQEVKVSASDKNSTTTEIMGDKLSLTLADHLQRAQLADSPMEEKLAALEDVFFVLSRFGCELEGSMTHLKDGVVAQVTRKKAENWRKINKIEEGAKGQPHVKNEEAAKKKESVRLYRLKDKYEVVLAYIAKFWDSHVAFQGTREMEDSMVPVLLPLAHLVQATC